MKIKVQNNEINPNSFAVMDLNFGQSRFFADKSIYYATVEFPEEYVINELSDYFVELKEDSEMFAEDLDYKWEKEICKYASYEDFRAKDTYSNVIPFLQFISQNMLTQLQNDKHIGLNDIPDYVLCALLEDSIRIIGKNIEISGICLKTEQ